MNPDLMRALDALSAAIAADDRQAIDAAAQWTASAWSAQRSQHPALTEAMVSHG